MWLMLCLGYLAVGLALVRLTRARDIIGDSMADVTTDTNPAWKVATFRLILHLASVLFWPFFAYGWFAKPRSAWDALNANPVFQQQMRLNDAMNLMAEDGIDADELPDGEGEFGLTSTNPIPCKTIFGSTAYLARLRTSNGEKVVYRRIGSTTTELSPHPVDCYEVSGQNGDPLGTLFISPYHKRNSGKAPKGFRLDPDQPAP